MFRHVTSNVASELGEAQVEPEKYLDLRYDKKQRFASYWHQIEQVVRCEPESVVEVGIGNGFLHRYLRQMGLSVHTVDFDGRLSPDTTASVVDLPFANREFDVAACYETLEHIPFEQFEPAVRELKRVARRFVLLSLPDVTPHLRLRLEVPFRRKDVDWMVDLPNPRPKRHEFDGEHYWELGKRGFSLRRITGILARLGLDVEETVRVIEFPYHRYLRCRVR